MFSLPDIQSTPKCLKHIDIHDFRSGASPPKKIDIFQFKTFYQFKETLRQAYSIPRTSHFIVCTINRVEITEQNYGELRENDMLYILSSIDQDLPGQSTQNINIEPYHHTITKSGLYEYYASEGQNPIGYAFAELIDNSLSATVKNGGERKIEIRMMLDDNPANCIIFAIDNGCGMSSVDLQQWATYRLSKHTRKIQKSRSLDVSASSTNEPPDPSSAPRSLNSDISFFGVGGKQAIFFIGEATRMITKPRGQKDVHELVISNEEFERKEQNNEAIYMIKMKNRKPGDASHTKPEEEALRKLIWEEVDRESFTYVVISAINFQNVDFLRKNFDDLCRQLSHIYHYYLHGPQGNVKNNRIPQSYKNINIVISLYWKGMLSKSTNLRDVPNDPQTCLIQSASKIFEFRALVDGNKTVEGVLRYHPFLYDHETYPKDGRHLGQSHENDEEEDGFSESRLTARGKRPIFECYWNGRLIPYSTIDELDWCATPKKEKTIPLECYNRVSGVLWTNSGFSVSTNKLTFMEFEPKIKDKNTIFTRVIGGQERRATLEKQFTDWLQECHRDCDREVKFFNFQRSIKRLDQSQKRQFPWAVYNAIEWEGRSFMTGQKVRICRTNPIIIGTIKSFLLFGYHVDTVYATGGEIEIQQEPSYLHEDVKTFPLVKLDRKATDADIENFLKEEEKKLPALLRISWPDKDEIKHNQKLKLGQIIGTIKVEILNQKDEPINKLPGNSQKKQLLLEMTIEKTDTKEVKHKFQCQHHPKWAYWFKKLSTDTLKELGPYAIRLQVQTNDGGGYVKDSGHQLPSQIINFTLMEGDPEKFRLVSQNDIYRIGMQFALSLEILDKAGNVSKPSLTADNWPKISAENLELAYNTAVIRNNMIHLRGIVAMGTINAGTTGQVTPVTIQVPGLVEDTQVVNLRFMPGPPEKLKVQTQNDNSTLENGNQIEFEVQIQDCSGNSTHDPKLVCHCQLPTNMGLTPNGYTFDLSDKIRGNLTTKPLYLKNLTEPTTILATFSVKNNKNIKPYECKLTIIPSSKAAKFVVTYLDHEGERVTLNPDKPLPWVAGETITGLKFDLNDECGNKVQLTSAIVSKIKLTWISSYNCDLLLNHNLPDIKVSSSVTQEQFCNLTYIPSEANSVPVEFDFNIIPHPGPPDHMKTSTKGSTTVKIGEILPAEIYISVHDSFGNLVTKLEEDSVKEVKISSHFVDQDLLSVTLTKDFQFLVKNIKITDQNLGSREIWFHFQNMKAYVQITVVPGPPKKLSYVNHSPDEVIHTYLNKPLAMPFIVQLIDDFGNDSSDSNVKVQLYVDSKLKTSPSNQVLKTNSNGRANFGSLSFSLLNDSLKPASCPLKHCPGLCYGVFKLMAKAFTSPLILGELLRVHITCDPGKPNSLTFESAIRSSYPVGSTLPEFSVHIVAEDESILQSTKLDTVEMLMWKTDETPVEYTAQSMSSPGVLVFRNIKVPNIAGIYHIRFMHDKLLSTEIEFTALPGPPIEISPENKLSMGVATVANTSSLAQRTIVKELPLTIKDEYGNGVSLGMSGILKLEIVSSNSENPSSEDIPCFESNVSTMEVALKEGRAVLSNIALACQSPGIDGAEYILRCTPILKHEITVPPFDINFLFYNDVKKKNEMSELTEKRKTLIYYIKEHQDFLKNNENLKHKIQDNKKKNDLAISKCKEDLKKLELAVSGLKTIADVEVAISKCHQSLKQIEKAKLRECEINKWPEEPGVLGKVGHLALIQEQDIARVISWSLQGDMDCLITHTMRVAKEVYQRTKGQQQILSLDSIYKKNLPEWNKPLPHTHISRYTPTGNPTYARHFLIFPKEQEKCRMVFGQLLGDTIILDTLDDATSYREKVVQYTFCPTLLTRKGDRIRSNGKFGGAQNCAPMHMKMMFGEPLPPKHGHVEAQIAHLEKLKENLKEAESIEEQIKHQREEETSSEFKEQLKYLKKAQEELNSVDADIGMNKSQLNRSTSSIQGTPKMTPLAKRKRDSSGLSNSSSPRGKGSSGAKRRRRL